MTEYVATFWENVRAELPEIESLIKSLQPHSYKLAMEKMNSIIKTSELTINVFLSIGSRNGMNLPERETHIEMTLSTAYLKKNKKVIENLYDAHHGYMPPSWTVLKYKYWHKSLLQAVAIDCTHDQEIIEITKEHFSYHPCVEEKSSKFSIILFVDDDIHKHILRSQLYAPKSKKIKARKIWVPSDGRVHDIVESAIGEFAMVNTLDKLEIHLKSSNEKVERFQLEHLTQTAQFISNNPYSKFKEILSKKCGRCGYLGVNLDLKKCSCGKTYYCDVACQKAHRSTHKFICS